MPRPNIQQYMHSIFFPFIEVTGLTPLLPKLKTQHLPDEIKDAQFEILSNIIFPSDGLILMGNSNFIARFECGDKKYIAINVENLCEDEVDGLTEFVITQELEIHRYEEAFFLSLRLNLGSNYKLKKSFRNKKASQNFIDVVNDDYTGHLINDIIQCYDDLLIIEVGADNIYYSSSMWYIAVVFAANFSEFRSPIVPIEIARKLEKLATYDHVPHDNLYVALTAIQWKYMFFELYKCLEKIYFLPWHFELKSEIGSEISSAKLAKICEITIGWRAKEKDSIQKLFSLVEEGIFSENFRENAVFKNIYTDPLVKTAFGNRVYKVRNLLVHQQDYEDKEVFEVDDKNWPGVVEFMCDLIENIYVRFSEEIKI